MDFVTGLAEIEADTYDEPPPRNKWEAFWQWLVRTFLLCCLAIALLLMSPFLDVTSRRCEWFNQFGGGVCGGLVLFLDNTDCVCFNDYTLSTDCLVPVNVFVTLCSLCLPDSLSMMNTQAKIHVLSASCRTRHISG